MHRRGSSTPSRGAGRLLALLAAMAVAMAACSSAASHSAPAPTTTPPTVRIPSSTEPLRVVLSGDSVMLDNLAFAFVAALNGAGEALVTQSWLLALSRDVASRLELRRILDEQHPDLLVMSVGVWELDAVEDEMHEPGWRGSYLEQVLQPFVDRATADGTHILWVGIPAWNQSEPETADLQTLQDIYRSLAREDDRVDFLDASAFVDDAGAFTYELPGPDGTPEQVRSRDGLHYCPAGVVRVVEPALAWIEQRWPAAVAPDWQHSGWELDPEGGGLRDSFAACAAA